MTCGFIKTRLIKSIENRDITPYKSIILII